MLDSVTIPEKKRTATRRAVRLKCQVMSDVWEGPAPHVIRDLSSRGVFLDSDLPLEVGEKVVVAVTPPGVAFPLYLYGRVRRVRFARRSTDGFSTGMGIEFERISGWDARTLERALVCLPEPAPMPRYGKPRVSAERRSRADAALGKILGAIRLRKAVKADEPVERRASTEA
jgi:hypothetical protein